MANLPVRGTLHGEAPVISNRIWFRYFKNFFFFLQCTKDSVECLRRYSQVELNVKHRSWNQT